MTYHDRPEQPPQHTAPELKLLCLRHGEGLALPAYETSGSSGMDLRAAIDEAAPFDIPPGGRAAIPTGLAIEIPSGFEGQVRPRSGLALKHGMTCLNAPGTIDSDYRGEVKIILANMGTENFTVTRGMRVAQLVIAPVAQARIVLVQTVGDTERGCGGFGSTGAA